MARSRWVALTLIVLLSGCGGGPARPSGTPEVHESWTGCPSGAQRGGAGLPPLGDDFAPVAVVICGTPLLPPPSGAPDPAASEQRSESVTDLVAALRLPSERRSGGPCTADLVLPPWFALIDAQGRWVRPGVPVDGCGKPRREVRAALDALPLTVVRSPAASFGAECERSWADMVSVQAGWGSAGPPPRGYVPAPDARMRLCVYEVPVSQQGTGKPAGDFVRGGPMTPKRWAAVGAELPQGVPARPCRQNARRFALLFEGDRDPIYVELDGCRRVLVGSALLQGTPGLTAAIG